MSKSMIAVGFEPTPFRTGALSQRLRPLGQTVLCGNAPGFQLAFPQHRPRFAAATSQPKKKAAAATKTHALIFIDIGKKKIVD